MRMYYFGNFYLSSIQQGIQASHVLGEIISNYCVVRKTHDADYNELVFDGTSPQAIMLAEFLVNHKTAILLNGGAQKDLEALNTFLEEGEKAEKNDFPFACFREEKDALNGALTSVGILLPFRIYNLVDFLRNSKGTDLELARYNIERQLNTKGFAYYDLEKAAQTTPPDTDYMINNRWEYDLAQLLTTYRLAS